MVKEDEKVTNNEDANNSKYFSSSFSSNVVLRVLVS